MATQLTPTSLPVVDRTIITDEILGQAPAVADPREQEIRDLYKSIGRAVPDAAGLEYWMGRTDLDSVGLKREFRGAAGLPYEEFEQPATDFEDRKDYIATLYREKLGREPDAAGLDFWANSEFQGDDLIKRMRDAAGLDNTLYEDPAMAAFMRTMAQREGTIEADRAARSRELENQRAIQSAMYDRQETMGLRDADREAESRGMYRSGGRIQNRADVATDIALNRANTEIDYTSQQNELNRNAATELATLSRQRDEQEIASRNNLTNQSITEAANG